MSSRKTKCALAAAFAIFSACAEQAPRPVIQTLQSGDGALACQEIASKVQHLDQIASGSTSGGMGLINAEPGVQAVVSNIAGYAGGHILSVVPALSGVVGVAAGLAGNAVSAAAQKQANTTAMARVRLQYLTSLYQEKHCAASEIGQAGPRMESTELSANGER